MLVCHCRGVSDRQIQRAVRNGACSLRDVARETGAGMRCGGCRSAVTEVFQQALEKEMRPSALRPSTLRSSTASTVASMMRLELPVVAEG